MIVAVVQDTGDVIVQSHLAIRSVDDLFVPPAEWWRKTIAPSAITIPESEIEVEHDESRLSQR
jgi:hypothetical protein